MSHECCSFCEQLPGTAKPGWAGQASKCPVCRQELWTNQNGTSYRLGAANRPARGFSRWRAGAGMLALGVIVAVCTHWARSNHAAPSPVQIQLAATLIAPTIVPRTVVDVEPTPVPPPEVRVKAIRSEAPARSKPMSEATRLAASSKASVKPIPVLFAGEGPQVKAAKRTIPTAWRWSYVRNASDLTAQLADVPELDLDTAYLKKSKKEIAEFAAQIVKANKDQPDAFIRKLMKDRSDLAGMPFRLGKDCNLDGAASKELAASSLQIRTALGKSIARPTSTPKNSITPRPGLDPDAYYFWNAMHEPGLKASWHDAKKIAALRQIVLVENEEFRGHYVAHVAAIAGSVSSDALANRAVFDLDQEVRFKAVEALRGRAKAEYRDALVKGLRHPWAPIVQHAAQALAMLEVKEAVPQLVALLDEPAPSVVRALPVVNGEAKYEVREMVRVNHHRNCLLCHAPVRDLKEVSSSRSSPNVPLGPCPSGQEELPPSSTVVYYSERSGSTLVRADVTYLRQDFSVRMQVDHAGKWPAKQRFDFLVRTRHLNAQEMAERKPAEDQGEYIEAIVSTLRILTGRDAPANSEAWREMLHLPKSVRKK